MTSEKAWKLIPLDLPPVRRTRPPRVFLQPEDVRVWRYTSLRYTEAPSLLSSLARSPAGRRHQQTQTVPRSRVTRGTQCRQEDSGSEWEAPPEPTTKDAATQCSPERPKVQLPQKEASVRISLPIALVEVCLRQASPTPTENTP